MERVSFKIAKALKEAGYPQNKSDYYYKTFYKDEEECCGEIVNTLVENTTKKDIRKDHTIISSVIFPLINAPAPTDVWLWLWREKKKDIDITFSADEGGWTFMQNPSPCDCGLYDDPEEAIIAAIDYLVDNKLIK